MERTVQLQDFAPFTHLFAPFPLSYFCLLEHPLHMTHEASLPDPLLRAHTTHSKNIVYLLQAGTDGERWGYNKNGSRYD